MLAKNLPSVVSWLDIPTLAQLYEARYIFDVAAGQVPVRRKRSKDDPAEKISIYQGDITEIAVDAIVNAANKTLLGGGGVDGAIHKAAGPELLRECRTLNGCETGEAKITKGYRLPASHVIHTVGPIGEKPHDLFKCYYNSLDLLKKNGLRTIAFSAISTGVYGYPVDKAVDVALDATKQWLKNPDNFNSVDRIIFCLFSQNALRAYTDKIFNVFP
jgi:O-acetyl-ADP-ribose deacetylase (regulator of RNase III)